MASTTVLNPEIESLMSQLNEAVARATRGQVQATVGSPAAPHVTVKAGFVKLPFEKFEKEYVEAKTLVHALRQGATGGRSFISADLEKPTFFLLLSSLQFLEQVIRLICACVPSGGIVGKEKIAKKVQEFVTITKGIFEPATSDSEAANTTLFNTEKGIFQTVRRELRKRGDSTKPRVSKKAYKGKKFQKQHFVVMVNFAKQLALVCRAMMCQLPEDRPQWLPSTWNWKSTIPSIEYLCVQRAETPQAAAVAKKTQKNGLRDAFQALNTATKEYSYIDNAALRAQSVTHATMLYTVLLETIVAMKNKWDIRETLSTVHTKLSQLNDAECKLFKEKNKKGLDHVFDKLSPFWGRDDSYQDMFKKLKTSKNAESVADKDACQKFCLALCYYAMAATPRIAKRTPVLVTCMDSVLAAAAQI